MKFGRWTVLHFDKETTSEKHKQYWICECSCEKHTIKSVLGSSLVNGKSKSCGCLQKKYNTLSLANKQFGNWKVLCRDETNLNKGVYWLCECQCEKHPIKSIRVDHLVKEEDVSCGCLKELNKRRKKNKYDLISKNYGIGFTNNTNKKFYFDKEDYSKIENFVWNEDVSGYIMSGVNINGLITTVKLHRLIMGVTDSDIHVDHIKHKLYDCRKSQLRIVTPHQNSLNRGLNSNNTSGVTGVYFHTKDNKWVAGISYKKVKYTKEFNTFEEAVEQRKRWEREFFKEYSYDASMQLVIN